MTRPVVFAVAPVVRVPHQMMSAPRGSDVTLECQIESHPVPSTLWLKAGRPLRMDGSVHGTGGEGEGDWDWDWDWDWAGTGTGKHVKYWGADTRNRSCEMGRRQKHE